jgi:hypothetical protein
MQATRTWKPTSMAKRLLPKTWSGDLISAIGECMFECLSPAGVIAAALIAPPGPDIITALAGLDVAGLSDGAQVDLLVAFERQAAWLAALVMPVLAAVGDRAHAAVKAGGSPRDGSDLSARAAHTEIAVALRMSEPVAASRLMVARDLTAELPAVHAALTAGDISLWHAAAICDESEPGNWYIPDDPDTIPDPTEEPHHHEADA